MESPSPDEQRAIVEEWADAKPIERFHRFAVVVTPEGPLTLFGLLDQNGEHHRFYCDANVIPTLACEFYGLAMKSQECRAATQAEEVPPVILDFETAHYSVLSPRGHPKITGNAILALHTSSGFTIQTLFGPRALTELTIMLEDTLAQMPKPISIKKGGRTSERILGESTPKGEAVTYFGQEYSAAIVQAFGVMMIRANVVERSLVYLLSAVTKASLDQAEAQFYSTANMKARLDLIKASVGASEINEYVKVVSNSGRDLKGEICKCLDQLSDVSDRRNSLVHGQYEFDGNKMKARLFKPNTSKPRKDIPVTEGYILEIAAAFNNAGAALSGMARTVLEFRDMASKTAATPSSGQPSN